MASAVVHITKLAAAERQLRAAIRLYFDEEDELAVHIVASATYRLLSDLSKARGIDVAADSYRTGFFYIVRDFRRGTLPEDMTANEELMAFVRSVAEKLPIKADSELDDISVTISPAIAVEFWKIRNKAANFLKHADRDATQSLRTEEIDNFLLLMQCVAAYNQLAQSDLGNEGLVFQLFIAASDRSKNPWPHLEPMAEKIRAIPDDERRRFCRAMITELADT
jgi:hypothetical protein